MHIRSEISADFSDAAISGSLVGASIFFLLQAVAAELCCGDRG